jgi:protein Mpv17
LEVGRQATWKTQQRLQHHLLAAAAARRPNLIIPYHNTHRFLSTSSLKKVGDAAAKTIQQAAASSKPASAVPPGRMTLVEWYEGHLDRNPLPTKMITGSLLWSLGDAVAQMVPPLAAGAPLPQYDVLRTGRACLFGFAIHAPTSHLHFNFLEYLTHRVGVKGLAIPVFKTIMEQFVYWSWVSNSMYHGAMGLMQGMSLSDIYQRLEDVLWDTQKAQWAFWIPVQLLNFQFIPVRHQLNVVLVTSVVWTALLSAWYPPVEEEEEGTVTKA